MRPQRAAAATYLSAPYLARAPLIASHSQGTRAASRLAGAKLECRCGQGGAPRIAALGPHLSKVPPAHSHTGHGPAPREPPPAPDHSRRRPSGPPAGANGLRCTIYRPGGRCYGRCRAAAAGGGVENPSWHIPQECLGDNNRDWTKCQAQVKALKACHDKQQLLAQGRAKQQ